MIREFVSWWVEQLVESIPVRWRRFGVFDNSALLVAPAKTTDSEIDTVEIYYRRAARITPLGRFTVSIDGLADVPHAGSPVVLLVDRADVLSKDLTLPLAAEMQLERALVFEMDRETPFLADEVYWNSRVLNRDRQRNQISVRLFLMPRIKLATLLSTLGSAGFRPTSAEIAGGPNDGIQLPLESDLKRRQGEPRRRRLRWAVAATCFGLAITAAVLPFIRQTKALAQLDRQIAKDRSIASEAETLRREIDNLTGAVTLIETERSNAGHPLATLATLTRMMPDDTYLTEFQQQQRKVTVSGRSAAASQLIAALAAGNELRNPAFAAPVTHFDGPRPEIFTITTEVAP